MKTVRRNIQSDARIGGEVAQLHQVAKDGAVDPVSDVFDWAGPGAFPCFFYGVDHARPDIRVG